VWTAEEAWPRVAFGLFLLALGLGIWVAVLVNKLDSVTSCNAVRDCGPDVCGNGLVYTGGKCEVNFDGEHELIIDGCEVGTKANGHKRTFDLKRYASHGHLPKLIRHGYENAKCTQDMYTEWQEERGKFFT
jgi:hypothetical protein